MSLIRRGSMGGREHTVCLSGPILDCMLGSPPYVSSGKLPAQVHKG